jgi:RNA polymerase sigma-70 factor (ECF subfamily)
LSRPQNIAGTGSTDEQLMQQVCGGNRMAFEILYDRYFDKLVWFAQRYTEDVSKAEDAVQEVFIKIIERPELFDNKRKFSTWVFTVTGNSCKDILRNESNRSRLFEENVAAHFSTTVVMHDPVELELLQQRIKNIFSSLSEKEKSIYVLRFEQELSIREIAEIIDIPEGTVKSGIFYLLKKFARQLKDFHYEK